MFLTTALYPVPPGFATMPNICGPRKDENVSCKCALL